MFTEYSISGTLLLLLITIIVLIRLIIEVYFHRKRLFSIPYRIHVNGTRGKSSVTRLIAAGLRAGNLVTVAKTTGTLARFIEPSGKEEAVYRFGRTNVIEQVRVVKKAAKFNPDALVIECMAVQPLLQSLCELKLIRSTHGVLVNARADHLDVMGPTERDVAFALAGTMPIRGKFFTPERKYFNVFAEAAKDRKSMTTQITEQQINAITDEEMAGFSYKEHKDNVALALAVCEDLGVDRQTALHGMWQATPDPGALTVYSIQYRQRTLILANVFAANDPVSTGVIWEKLLSQLTVHDKVIGLVNCRFDRGDRSKQMAEAIITWTLPDEILAIGSGVTSFTKTLERSQTLTPLTHGEGWNVEKILNHVAKNSENGSTILLIGICNIKDIGFELLNYFEKNREVL